MNPIGSDIRGCYQHTGVCGRGVSGPVSNSVAALPYHASCMLNLLVHLEVKPEWLTEFSSAVRQNASRSVVDDHGCRRFDVYVDEESPTRFVLHEVYDSEADWEAHRASPHFLAYKAIADRALVSRTLTRVKPF
jgi:(4S)-4-hydroxy-5-phosphonooxypentane-2,3-dione isomerase